ncbi:MAG: ribonuclease III [Candidatus Dadabacteria bacterium]|nr:ribonuclease III [Candidatus Dadabacteria bacterium]NIQ14471.1 ribonuclease III [Candidatus Dadabacteria bacterium]
MIEEKLQYKFKDNNLLKTALTHSSYANEYSVESNERLEFLGDSILGCVVSKILYQKFPDSSEGELSKIKGAIVSRSNFAKYALDLKLNEQILLGKGEESTGGKERDSNLSGAFEAVIGAIYLDAGYRKSYQIISKLVKSTISNKEFFSDNKTKLQEITQKKFKQIPKYNIIREEGPPHNKIFFVEVKVSSEILGNGIGKNKKEAEQSAAKEALNRLSM